MAELLRFVIDHNFGDESGYQIIEAGSLAAAFRKAAEWANNQDAYVAGTMTSVGIRYKLRAADANGEPTGPVLVQWDQVWKQD